MRVKVHQCHRPIVTREASHEVQRANERAAARRRDACTDDTKADTTGFNRCVDQRSQVNNPRRSELDVFAGANGLKKTRCALERAAQGWVTPDKASNTPQKSLTRCVKWGSADIFFFFFFLFLFFFLILLI